jgi:Superinfection immunity protein
MSDASGLSVWLLVVGVLVYFFPTLIAMVRLRENTMAICALNLFLGWSLVGWVLALVWAISTTAPATRIKGAESAVGRAKCPARAELIPRDANKCRFCGDTVVRKGFFGKLRSRTTANHRGDVR